MTDTASNPETIRFAYVLRPGLWRLILINFLLNLVTLTIYRFWAKTNVRRHIWSCVHVNGLPLEYTGTGKELFIGFLKVMAVFTLPIFAALTVVQLTYGLDHPIVVMVQFVVLFAVYVLWGAALYMTRRYQLSRTTWRGIRGTLTGSPIIYSILYFGTLLGRSMSFGWATPVLNVALQEKMIGEMRFGDLAFKFRGRAGPLYPTYALCWFLSIGAVIVITVGFALFVAGAGSMFQSLDAIMTSPEGQNETAKFWIGLSVGLFFVLGYLVAYPLVWSIYTAKEIRTFAEYTKAGDASFSFNATAGSLVWLTLGNIVIFILTLGIARPLVQQRIARYFCDRIVVNGTIDVDAISQSMGKYDKSGEGLADAFDLSVF